MIDVEDNLIAAFDGYVIRIVDDTSVNYTAPYEKASYSLYAKNGITTDEVFYKTSLDALDSVIRKIWKLNLSTCHMYTTNSQVEYFSIFDDQYRNTAKGLQFYAEGENCVYVAIVKFIKWYNKEVEIGNIKKLN